MMKRLLPLLILVPLAALADSSPRWYEYGVGQTITFDLIDSTGSLVTGITASMTCGADGAAKSATTNSVSELANGQYEIAFTAAEMQVARLDCLVTGTGAEDESIKIETYGDASSQHPDVTAVQDGSITPAKFSDEALAALGSLNPTTIDAVTSNAQFTLVSGSADDNAYPRGTIVMVMDQSTPTQKAIGLVREYDGATKEVFLEFDPNVFTFASGDHVFFIATGR